MIVLVIAAGIIPSLLFYLWLSRQKKDSAYRTSCRNALFNGFLCTLPLLLCDLVLSLLWAFLGFGKENAILDEAYRSFLMFALMEEMWKFIFFKKTLEKAERPVSGLDVIAFMTLVGVGFEILESIVMSFTAGVGQAIVRGLTIMHGVFGFLMGYYYVKGLHTGRKGWYVLSFLVPFLYHGIYDFCLSEKLSELSFWFDFIPVTLAALSPVLLIVMIVFFKKKKNDPLYTAPVLEKNE